MNVHTQKVPAGPASLMPRTLLQPPSRYEMWAGDPQAVFARMTSTAGTWYWTATEFKGIRTLQVRMTRKVLRWKLGGTFASRDGVGRSLLLYGIGQGAWGVWPQVAMAMVCEGRRMESRVVAPHRPQLVLHRRGPREFSCVQTIPSVGKQAFGRGHPRACDVGDSRRGSRS